MKPKVFINTISLLSPLKRIRVYIYKISKKLKMRYIDMIIHIANQKFNWEKSAKEHIELFKGLLSENSNSS